LNRRRFIRFSALATAALPGPAAGAGPAEPAGAPLLHLDAIESPIVIDSIELLRHGREYLVRLRSKDGAESVTVPNSDRMGLAAPVFLQRVAPFFIGKDARKIETLIDGVYRHASNYKVTKALDIPIAGGEQEFSMNRIRWVIENRIVDVIQPDLHYFGGFIRCARVARMANANGMPCTVHMSGGGLGILQVLHFTSFVADPGAHQEFKGEPKIPLEIRGGDLRCRDGMMSVPAGPGFGVTIDPGFVARAVPVR
jgi:L-alanine-DL-glutamate epimerase-like enolase superfamily enzyme